MATDQRGRVKTEPSAKRLRAYLGGRLVLDTTHPLLVWEIPYYPAYYVPSADVVAELEQTGKTEHSPSRGEAEVLTLRIGGPRGRRRRAALPRQPDRGDPRPRAGRVGRHGRVVRGGRGGVHPPPQPVRPHRHPADAPARSSSATGDVELARSTRPHALFETGLPTRWYVPRVDVRMDLLRPSDTVTHCPYKGAASHMHAVVGDDRIEDMAWSYPTPLPESERIAGLVSSTTTG